MTHIRKSLSLSFDVQTAIEYGVDESIMIYNLRHWIEHNIGNKKHNYDGRTWTYNTQEAFAYLFPFWSKKQVWRILNSLEKQGVIIKGNYNQHAYDRTQWYAFKDEEKWVRSFDNAPQTLEDVHIPKKEFGNSQTRTSKFPNENKQIPKAEFANSQPAPTIPNNYQITTNNYNNSETVDSNNHAVNAHELLLSLNFEENLKVKESESVSHTEEKAERQKEMVKFPIFENFDLTESEKAEVNKKLASLSQEQRDIAIQAISSAVMEDDIVYIRNILARGMRGELKPFKKRNNVTHTPTQETLFTPVSGENNAVNDEASRKETTLEILKLKVAKYKDRMLAEYKQKRAVFIQGLGVFYDDDLRAAGLFD